MESITMTIRDILDSGIEIQGKVEVRQWREELNDNMIFCFTDNANFTDEALDMKITFIWTMENTLIIEVE